jgi:mRNA (guanine-N7-)-methyltransferase
MNITRHYNQHRPRSNTSDEMIGIRNFHNFVKATLISEACQRTQASRYLDICCGNGGDIGKLVHNGINEYFGLDIANEAVERASQKLSEQSDVKGDVIAFNAFSTTAGHMLSSMKDFDIVSCQFAIHYAFVDEQTARTFVQNVAYALRVGGSFIIKVPDEEYLVKSRKLLGKRFGDEYHNVHFETSEELKDFGSAYEFSFKGAVDKLKEYVVKREVLIALCNDCGMELISSRNFSEYNSHKDTPLWSRMKVTYNQVSRIYTTYHFVMNEFTSTSD